MLCIVNERHYNKEHFSLSSTRGGKVLNFCIKKKYSVVGTQADISFFSFELTLI